MGLAQLLDAQRERGSDALPGRIRERGVRYEASVDENEAGDKIRLLRSQRGRVQALRERQRAIAARLRELFFTTAADSPQTPPARTI